MSSQDLATPSMLFTRADALAAGYSEYEVRRFLRAKEWLSPVPGVYVEAAGVDAAGADPFALRASALRLRFAPDGLVSHWSAAQLHNLPLFRDRSNLADLGTVAKPRDIVAVTRPATIHDRPQRHRQAIVQQAGLWLADRALVHRVAVTSPARTVVDLARRWSFPAGVVTADAALREGLASGADLDLVLRRCHGWPGIAHARDVVAFARQEAESPLESLARVMYHVQGVEPPELQATIRDGAEFIGRVDFLWRRHRVIGECDGLLKYDGDPAALRQEKLRQERLEAMGFIVIRMTWEQVLWQPERTVERTVEAFERARALRLP